MITISVHGAAVLAPRLACFTALTDHHLAPNQMGCAGAGALRPHPTFITSLEHLSRLSLPDNDMCVEDITVLASPLACLSSLVLLDLQSNRIGNEGAAVLGLHLASLPWLHRLILADTGIVAQGACTLLPHLTSLTVLRDVNLAEDAIGPERASALDVTSQGSHASRIYFWKAAR